MEKYSCIILLFNCACLATLIPNELDFTYTCDEESDDVCHQSPIASSLMFKMFPPDIVKNQNLGVTEKFPNTSCYFINNNNEFVISGDIDAIRLKKSEMNINVVDTRVCDSIPELSDSNDVDSLTVSNTQIRILNKGAFANWTGLETLKIISNNFLESIEGGAFENLTNVWKLEIMVNEKLGSFNVDSFEGLTNLRALFLKRNNISNISDISKALTKKYVPNLLVLDLTENNILTISKNDFLPMEGTNLYTLMIGLTKTVYIHPKALDPFKDSIVSLGFSQVNVEKDTLVNFINRTTIVNKNLTYLSLRENLLCGSPRDLMKVISNSVVGLDLGNNHFGLMEPGFFPVMNKLKYLDLTNVMMDEIPESIINSTVFPKLEHLYLGGNMITKITPAMVTPTLSRLVVSNSPITNDDTGQMSANFEIGSGVLKMMPDLEVLDLSGNNINKLTPSLFYHAVKLKVLFLHRTSLISIQNRSFERNQKLYFLDLSNNMFPMINTLNGEIFYGLMNLLALDLSYCYINSLSYDLFDYIPKLQYLSLKGNSLAVIDPILFSYLPCLKILDLRYNILVSWHEQMFHKNHRLEKLMLIYNNIMKLTDAMLIDFNHIKNINLFANSISCDCNLYHSIINNNINASKLKYLIKTKCSYPVGMNLSIHKYLQQPLYECISYRNPIIISSVMLVIILMLVLVILYFKYKYDVQYRLLLLKKKLGIVNMYRSKETCSVYQGRYKYDAFVSYSNQDSSFVEKMIMILEKDNSKYKLCVFERDFQPGDNLVDRILDCMDVSMVTILILTEAFAKSEWCRWEMSIAQNKLISQHFLKDSLILIIKSRIPDSLMTPTLKYLMDTRVYLEWHEHSSVRQNIFWEKLKDALKEKMNLPKMPLPDITNLTSNGTDTHLDDENS